MKFTTVDRILDQNDGDEELLVAAFLALKHAQAINAPIDEKQF